RRRPRACGRADPVLARHQVRQGPACGGAEPRRGAAHGHQRVGCDCLRVRAVGFLCRRCRHPDRAAVHDLVDHGHAVRHQGLCRRDTRRHHQPVGGRRGGPDLRARRGADHRVAGVHVHPDRDVLSRHSGTGAQARRSVRPRSGEKGMNWRAILIGAPLIALAAVAINYANGYHVYIISLVGLTAIVGIGLNILLGLTGQISLGHVGFYAIGAYTAGLLMVRLGWSFWLALPVAGLLAGIAGALLSIPALRVRGPYLAMVTIAFGFVVEQSAAEWDELTGGWNGLMGIPAPSILGDSFNQREIAWLVLGRAVIMLILYSRLSHSPWGKAMRAIRDSEIAGQSIGFAPVPLRAAAFALSAVAAGIAGAVFASMTNFISPESFPFFDSILFLLVVMIGGADAVL